MPNTAIRVSNLVKAYRIGEMEEKSDTLAGALKNTLLSPFRNYKRLRSLSSFQDQREDKYLAMNDVSFEINHGEVVGIIGRNGAGKSTLLKILSRITDPTEGQIEVFGRISSLLEVGTGFHPELTGRENVYLNGTILGMRKSEIDSKFEQIVEFAGISRFLDTPVKRYSSGMRVRLAFSVAAHLNAEILLIDEVLAVGDIEFQKKCMGKMNDVAKDGRTILFVSHNMQAVEGLCDRAIWLQQGTIIEDGPSGEVVPHYLTAMLSGGFSHTNHNAGFTITNVILRNSNGEASFDFRPGEDLTVEVHYDTAEKSLEDPSFLVTVNSILGPCFAANMLLDGANPKTLNGQGVISCTFKSIPLLPQSYTINLQVKGDYGKTNIVPSQEVANFVVSGDLQNYGLKGPYAYKLAEKSISVMTDYTWTLPNGEVTNISLGKKELSGSLEV